MWATFPKLAQFSSLLPISLALLMLLAISDPTVQPGSIGLWSPLLNPHLSVAFVIRLRNLDHHIFKLSNNNFNSYISFSEEHACRPSYLCCTIAECSNSIKALLVALVRCYCLFLLFVFVFK